MRRLSPALSVVKRWPDWRQKINVIVQLSLTRHPDLPDIPLIFDYIKPGQVAGLTLDEVDNAWRIMLVQKVMGRPFAVGPNVPPERVKVLREAFVKALRDPELKSEADRARNEINAVDGDDVQSMLAKVRTTPKSVIDLLKTAVAAKPDEGGTGPAKP